MLTSSLRQIRKNGVTLFSNSALEANKVAMLPSGFPFGTLRELAFGRYRVARLE